MSRFDTQLRALDEQLGKHADHIKQLYGKAQEEGRGPTDAERLEAEDHRRRMDVLKDEKDRVKAAIDELAEVQEITGKMGPSVDVSVKPGGEPHDRMHAQIVKSLGEEFTDSEGYRRAVAEFKSAGGRLPQNFSTGAVPLQAKGTLMEGPGGGGGALASTVPQVVPGVVDKLFQRLTVADLLLSGQASTNSLRYVVEGTATSGAAGVGEGGAKPQSTLGLTTTDEPIKKIATSLKVSDEMIEDAPAIQSYISGRLVLFVRIEEERQLLRGTSGGNEVQGLLTSRSVPIYAGGTAAGNKAEQLFKAMNGMRGSAFVEPEWIIMHPDDWQDLRLLKDSSNQFYGGGPFQGQYGGPQGMVGVNGQVTGADDTIWNKPVHVTAIAGSGTALVGTRANAQVWRRGGLSVEVTNSNENDFLNNLVAIRAEERLGLAVYRPGGYVEVRLA